MNIHNDYENVKTIKVKNAQTITFEHEAPVESNLEQFMRGTDLLLATILRKDICENDYSKEEIEKTQKLLNFYGGMI